MQQPKYKEGAGRVGRCGAKTEEDMVRASKWVPRQIEHTRG